MPLRDNYSLFRQISIFLDIGVKARNLVVILP